MYIFFSTYNLLLEIEENRLLTVGDTTEIAKIISCVACTTSILV